MTSLVCFILVIFNHYYTRAYRCRLSKKSGLKHKASLKKAVIYYILYILKYGEGAENFNGGFRHHIDFYKPSMDPMNLIILGNLHYRYIYAESIQDLDYYSRMRYMRNCFQDAIPPSFWESDLQDRYIERLIEFVTEWENNKAIQYTWQGPNRYVFVDGKWVVDTSKIDFIEIKYLGETYNLQGMLKKGWITEDWVDGIIQDIRQKLESRGLL